MLGQALRRAATPERAAAKEGPEAGDSTPGSCEAEPRGGPCDGAGAGPCYEGVPEVIIHPVKVTLPHTAEASPTAKIARPALKILTPLGSPPPRFLSAPATPDLVRAESGGAHLAELPDDLLLPCLLPGIDRRRVRMSLPSFEESSPPSAADAEGAGPRRFQSLKLATPSSCASAHHRYAVTPTTPDPSRACFRLIGEGVQAIFFDFDGTLTETPGQNATQHCTKKAQLKERSDMLAPRLKGLRDAGITLAIISKSTEQTIRESLLDAGLDQFFDGPILGKAIGFEGKAGFIRDLYESGDLDLGPEGLRHVLLVDDDVRELDRAQERGIQAFAAPADGGLLDSDFDEIFACLGLPSPRGKGDGICSE